MDKGTPWLAFETQSVVQCCSMGIQPSYAIYQVVLSKFVQFHTSKNFLTLLIASIGLLIRWREILVCRLNFWVQFTSQFEFGLVIWTLTSCWHDCLLFLFCGYDLHCISWHGIFHMQRLVSIEAILFLDLSLGEAFHISSDRLCMILLCICVAPPSVFNEDVQGSNPPSSNYWIIKKVVIVNLQMSVKYHSLFFVRHQHVYWNV